MNAPRRTTSHSARDATPSDPLSQLEASEIARAIVSARKRAGMTQVEIARAMGVAQSAIAKLESGRSMPRITTLQRLARATSSRIHLSIDPVSIHDMNTASHQMTDTLSRPATHTQANRRAFLGGIMGVAGLLSHPGTVRHVSAQEATAAATAVADYVWTPIEWREEQPIFTVIERGETETIVETPDGQITVPSNPQRLVTLDDEQIPLFELGVDQNIVGYGYTSVSEELPNVGELSDSLHARFADVPSVGQSRELDIERVLKLDPDLILGYSYYNDDTQYQQMSPFAPFIRKGLRVTDVPRGAIRDFGQLFGAVDEAAAVLAEHEAYITRAKDAVATAAAGKRVLFGVDIPSIGEFYAITSHYLLNGDVSASSSAYPGYRDLGLQPTSFVEILAAQDREAFGLTFSFEEFGNVDADIVFYLGYDFEEQFAAFLESPITQSIPAYANNAIHYYDEGAFGMGLAGSRAAVKFIVETLTGEPFA